jgi:3D (Asp-Asp-Asp) domain-containing protein
MYKNSLSLFVILFLVANADICEAPVAKSNTLDTSGFDIPKISNYLVSRASIYQAVPEQTNEDNLTTASGFKLDSSYVHSKHRIIAISRDLLEHFPFGTRVKVTGANKYDGYWTVHDLMNKRYVSAIDFLTDIGTPNTLYTDITITKLND